MGIGTPLHAGSNSTIGTATPRSAGIITTDGIQLLRAISAPYVLDGLEVVPPNQDQLLSLSRSSSEAEIARLAGRWQRVLETGRLGESALAEFDGSSGPPINSAWLGILGSSRIRQETKPGGATRPYSSEFRPGYDAVRNPRQDQLIQALQLRQNHIASLGGMRGSMRRLAQDVGHGSSSCEDLIRVEVVRLRNGAAGIRFTNLSRVPLHHVVLFTQCDPDPDQIQATRIQKESKVGTLLRSYGFEGNSHGDPARITYSLSNLASYGQGAMAYLPKLSAGSYAEVFLAHPEFLEVARGVEGSLFSEECSTVEKPSMVLPARQSLAPTPGYPLAAQQPRVTPVSGVQRSGALPYNRNQLGMPMGDRVQPGTSGRSISPLGQDRNFKPVQTPSFTNQGIRPPSNPRKR